MTVKEYKKISRRLGDFIKMCENDFEEDGHIIKNPVTYEEFEQIQQLNLKLTNCINYVDGNIFE